MGNPIQREAIVFDHDLGLAGRCDWIGHGAGPLEGRVVIPDWKTQNVKKDKKGKKVANYYASWPRQLAFYSVSYAKQTGMFPDIPTCVSVVFDSNEPEDPFVKIWTKEEIMSAYEDVVIAAYRWFKRKNYFPHPNGMFKLTTTLPLPQ